MTHQRARFEIFLLVMRFIRSIFFNLFMLGLGFALGTGFCMGMIKARKHMLFHRLQDRSAICAHQVEIPPTNAVDTVKTSNSRDGKQDF